MSKTAESKRGERDETPSESLLNNNLTAGNTPTGFRIIWSYVVTLFLFTQSDFKTVVLPQSVFALSLALSQERLLSIDQPRWGTVVSRLPYMLAWIWVHLLVENIANQRLAGSIIEDMTNKPWRPVASGRITPIKARDILRLAVVLAIFLSVLLKSFTPSTTLMTMIWLYNDLEGSSLGSWQRNLLNAAGLACFGWGATSVLLAGAVDDVGRLAGWLLLTSVIITTTIHAQDLPDLAGDRARERRTVPLVYGENWARWTVAGLTPFWSVICTTFWRVPLIVVVVPLGIALLMAGVILLRRDQKSSQCGWKLWCFWITILYSLPLSSNTA